MDTVVWDLYCTVVAALQNREAFSVGIGRQAIIIRYFYKLLPYFISVLYKSAYT